VKNIEPPESVRNAMERQVTAEREKRALVAKSLGTKESMINDSEGKKAEMINQSEGDMRRLINRSEGEMRRRINEAEGISQEINPRFYCRLISLISKRL